MTKNGNDAVFDRLTKLAHFIPTETMATMEDTARLFLDDIYKLQGLPEGIISDRDSKFTGNFWQALFEALGTRLGVSTAFHPPTDGQLGHYVGPVHDTWEEWLIFYEFAVNNAYRDYAISVELLAESWSGCTALENLQHSPFSKARICSSAEKRIV